MPLTSSPIDLEDIEARRRAAEALRQSSAGAGKMGVDALAAMEALAFKKDTQKTAAEQARLKLELATSADKRAAEKAAADAANVTADNKRADDAAERERVRLENTDTEKARADGRLVLKKIIADAQANKRSLDDILPAARENPALADLTGDEEVAGEWADQARERAKEAEDLRQKNLDRASREKAAALSAQNAAAPTVKDAEDVTNIDVALLQATKLARDKGEIDTGPIAALQNKLAQMVGVDDPKVTTFRASVGEQLAQYIKSISGATVSEPERAQLLQNVPTMTDDDTAFAAKLKRVVEMLEQKRTAKVDAIHAGGKNTDAFKRAPVPAPAPKPHSSMSEAELAKREAELRAVVGR